MNGHEQGIDVEVQAFARMFEQTYLRFHRRDERRSAMSGTARAVLLHLARTGPLTAPRTPASGRPEGNSRLGVSWHLEHVFGTSVVHSVGLESRRPQVRSRPSALSVGASSVIGDDQSPRGRPIDGGSSDHTVRTAFRERPFPR